MGAFSLIVVINLLNRCVIVNLSRQMAVQVTPEYFPNGRFGPVILDSHIGSNSSTAIDVDPIKSTRGSVKTTKGRYFSLSSFPIYNLIVRRVVDLYSIEDSSLDLLRHEVLTLRKLCHPNILPILSAEVNGHSLSMAMPFAERGSCRHILDKHFEYGFKEKVIKHILTSVLSAIYYLHLNALIHTRICSRNVLLSVQGHVYLTGFEYAQNVSLKGGVLHELPRDIIDYLPWTAPEVLAQDTRGFSYPADIYSIGALGVELNNGIPPFTDFSNPLPPSLVMLEKLKGFTPRLLDSSTMEVDECLDMPGEGNSFEGNRMAMFNQLVVFRQRILSPDFHQLVNSCCRTNPFTRPTAEQLLSICPFTNPIDQRRLSVTGELESELPIVELPLDDSKLQETAPQQRERLVGGTFETIEEENESQLSSQIQECVSGDVVDSTTNSLLIPNSYWNF